MLLDTDVLAEDLQAQANQMGARGKWDPSALLAAHAEAEGLAASIQSNEPAALFFALARRSGAFGKLAATFIPSAARAQAAAIGYELLLEDIELALFRTGVLRGELTFDHLRAWFADALRPLGALR